MCFFVTAWPYFPWRGKIQIGGHSVDVGLRATDGAWTPVKLYVNMGINSQKKILPWHLHFVTGFLYFLSKGLLC